MRQAVLDRYWELLFDRWVFKKTNPFAPKDENGKAVGYWKTNLQFWWRVTNFWINKSKLILIAWRLYIVESTIYQIYMYEGKSLWADRMAIGYWDQADYSPRDNIIEQKAYEIWLGQQGRGQSIKVTVCELMKRNIVDTQTKKFRRERVYVGSCSQYV